MRRLLRACDALRETLPADAPPLTDSEIFITCEPCGKIALNSLFLTLKAESTYTCPTSLKPVVIVAAVDKAPAWQRATCVGDFVIWHSGELYFRGMRLSRSRLALREIRTRATKERRKRRG